ncbi:PREDICTED: ubiquitin carboxyl-terminal hydrolase 8-like isoform X2 [Wasmannia auropunctata]|uniref:ubiquitin carboxyl-terminal hydrolase 8-like isoform X2 n=1 Tax=Wasmannia auropunctata TaxID=64793 RepID=UPI0005ED93D6|nr:PREDICTED: ubiquitin carboxyl-terminal hydrolase 8-like isoform X2 [Wasmannia auropunctata]
MSNATKLTYTCVNDLVQKAKINFAGKDPRNVHQRLSAMRQKADLARKQGDDETAFILTKRWLDAVEWLKRSHKSTAYATSTTVDQINEVKNVLADLKQKLDVRYELSSKKKCNDKVEIMEVETDEREAPNSDIGLKLPEIPTEDPLYISLRSDCDKFITCIQLYQLIQKSCVKYLIIDTRQKAHYESSRMSSDRCINIPQSEIKTGLLASYFEKYLANDKHSYDLFVNRSSRNTDVLILLDWNSTQDTLTPYTHVNVLKNIFEKWDPGTDHKRIKILNGGYQAWLERYPAFTTNPNIQMPEIKYVEFDEKILESFEYPDYVNSDPEDENMEKQRTKNEFNNVSGFIKDVEMDHGDNNKSATSRHARSNSNDTVSSAKSKNFVTHVTISIDDKRPSRGDGANGKLGSPEHPVIAQPRVSLNKVPQSEVSAKPVIDRSSKPTTLKAHDPRCKEVLRYMKELTELARSKSKLANELLGQEYELYSQREEKYSASDERYLQSEIKSLKVKLEDMHKMYLKVENEYKTYSEENCTDTIKFNQTDDHEKKNLEFTLSLTKNELKDIETKRKKLQEEFLQREHKEIMKQNDSDVHKEPLKTDGGSSINTGLERSYSSPNLLQHPGITGLKNLGNSCYMNSIIQCLSNTTNLAKYFTDNSYADDLNTSNDNMTQGQVVEEVAQVIKALWRGQYKSISPHDLKVAVGQYKLQFESYEQQDSHEFLTFLLDWMHNDLKKDVKVPIEMTNAEKEWDKAMNSQRSIISDLFFGQLRSTITCSFCKQASTTYETFNSLTMSLSQSNRCTLNDCMEKFVIGQKVSGWKCPKCQTPRDATKKFDFVKLAPIVVIHLNRFAESGGWLEKRNTAVDFPLTGFNLRPYLVTENPKAIMSNNIRNYNYSLYAISNHYGTMDGGHYTAFCKNATQNKWYKYDDQTVTEVSPSQVKSQNTSAYLLFYTSFPNTIM